MKDSGVEWIGMIPDGWNVSKIKYFFDCYDGKRVPVDSGERKKGPYPYWGAGSITDYSFFFALMIAVTYHFFCNSESKLWANHGLFWIKSSSQYTSKLPY